MKLEKLGALIQAKLGVDAYKLSEDDFIKKGVEALWIKENEKQMLINAFETTIRRLFAPA